MFVFLFTFLVLSVYFLYLMLLILIFTLILIFNFYFLTFMAFLKVTVFNSSQTLTCLAQFQSIFCIDISSACKIVNTYRKKLKRRKKFYNGYPSVNAIVPFNN